MSGSKKTKEARLNRIVSVIGDRKMSRDEIAEEMELDRTQTWDYLKILRECELKRVYVSGHTLSKTRVTSLYSVGSLPDVPAPTWSELADEIEKAAKPRAVVKVRRHPLDVAFFGEYRPAKKLRKIGGME